MGGLQAVRWLQQHPGNCSSSPFSERVELLRREIVTTCAICEMSSVFLFLQQRPAWDQKRWRVHQDNRGEVRQGQDRLRRVSRTKAWLYHEVRWLRLILPKGHLEDNKNDFGVFLQISMIYSPLHHHICCFKFETSKTNHKNLLKLKISFIGQ